MKQWAVAIIAVLFLSGCTAHRLFYFPDSKLYVDPDKLGLSYEVVTYPSLNGKKLVGVYFKAQGPTVGTVVHCHGNAHNVSDHFPLALFLRKGGFDILSFDYQGFGASEGLPSPEGTIEDAVASVRYAVSRLAPGARGVVFFGQSLGVAVAVGAAAREPAVKALALEGGFNSYRVITRTVLRRSWILWPISALLPPILIRKTWDPEKVVADLAPRPLLVIHGTADRVVPAVLSERLFALAREPKELWLIAGAGHLQCHRVAGAAYEEKIIGFFHRALGLTEKN
ncbi:MAG: alpha/beta hydrolase [Elusimicrobia bacterium]|jgi:fermentation-respiration switch protein FrsA (DUF1100 family)|nr:alpha/beta hydrolase [Elusimicrobiota bacterium]MBK7207523.1 alpha/beta hydrolase [Elusimicrobiota bacterium]MBK7544293.1 alpha/beta hydrolase [Elusimicrobiota bacterium]MBK7573815.1 alpha/beta hydrolase [Elusimicrobiota bacterium]MBK7689413.1 alpha/beta hydrolase [Elusimicrobiota bacterium]